MTYISNIPNNSISNNLNINKDNKNTIINNTSITPKFKIKLQ